MTFKATTIFCLVLALNAINAEELCNEPCKNADCMDAYPDDCLETQKYLIADPENGKCCSECRDCEPEICALYGECMYVGPENCTKEERFVPYDGFCNCCCSCEKCDPNHCPRVDCMSVDPSDCKEDEEFVPGDGLCTCCSYCQKFSFF